MINSNVKKAIPKLSDYRERFKKHQISPRELVVQNLPKEKLIKADGGLESFQYKGDKLFFGPGVEEDTGF